MKKALVFTIVNLVYSFLFSIVMWTVSNAQESEVGLNKGLWQQRTYPQDTIPRDAFKNATEQMAVYDQAKGYFQWTAWSSIGPFTDGNIPGRVTSIEFSPANTDLIYLTAHGGGVWRSGDRGLSFTPLDQNLPTQSSGCVCIDPNATSTVYYATGGTVDNFLYNYYGMGVYKSETYGANWTPISNGLPSQTHSYKIQVCPLNGYILYLAERNAL